MLIEFLIEEESMEQALRRLIPKICAGEDVYAQIHNFRGKQTLLKKLPQLFHGYARRAAHEEDLRVIVLVDNDGGDCDDLKKKLENMARDAGLLTKTEQAKRRQDGGGFTAVNRIVVEELESWFLGDPSALRRAFNRLPGSFENREPYRNPEQNNAWEALRRLLNESRYYAAAEPFPKPEVAELIAEHMNVDENTSRSFNAFVDGLRACI